MGPFSVNVSAQGVILNPAEVFVATSDFGFSAGCVAGRFLTRGRAFAGQHLTKKHSLRGHCFKGDSHNAQKLLFSLELSIKSAPNSIDKKEQFNITMIDDGSLVK